MLSRPGNTLNIVSNGVGKVKNYMVLVAIKTLFGFDYLAKDRKKLQKEKKENAEAKESVDAKESVRCKKPLLACCPF